MNNYKEFPDFNLSKEEIIKETKNFYYELINLYLELLNCYNDLNVALDEAYESEDVDIDTYVHAMHKISYLSVRIPDLTDKETEIFENNNILLPYLEEYIKNEYNLNKDLDFDKFSFHDIFIEKEYQKIKDNLVLIRIIRAIKYYKSYNDVYEDLLKSMYQAPDEDSVKDCIAYDYSDIEVINTLNMIEVSFEDENTSYLYNKYKCIYAFTNPTIERYFINRDILEDHPFIICDFDKKISQKVKNKVVKCMIAIHNNKVINQKHNNAVINDKLTIKQIFEILFKYNKNITKYSNRLDMLQNNYLDNIEEVGVIFAYMQQAYINLDEKSLKDIDHLFSAMVDNEMISMGSTTLKKKIVDHFFNIDEILNAKGIQRIKKKKDE